jgi:predicted ATPase
MIRQWRLTNFKAFRDLTLDLAPLTILAGANSSGKSTILQSILLVSQTLASKVAIQPLVLNGPLVRLGAFGDITSFGDVANELRIGWTLGDDVRLSQLTRFSLAPRFTEGPSGSREDEISVLRCDAGFQLPSGSPGTDPRLEQPVLTSCRIELADEAGAKINWIEIGERREGTDRELPLPRIGRLWAYGDSSYTTHGVTDLDDRSRDRIRADRRTAKIDACAVRHFLPADVIIRVDPAREAALEIMDLLTGEVSTRSTRSMTFASTRMQLHPEVIRLLQRTLGEELFSELGLKLSPTSLQDAQRKTSVTVSALSRSISSLPLDRREELQDQLRKSRTRLEEVLRATLTRTIRPGDTTGIRQRLPATTAASYIDALFSGQVRYLGPLRDEPKAVYPIGQSADPMDVGSRGEHTAAVLHLYQRRSVKCIPTSYFSGKPTFTTADVRGATGQVALSHAVKDWLGYFGVIEAVRTADAGKLGHQLEVTTRANEPFHDLTHVGVGVSQVLPIVVMCLLAPVGSVLVLEQPELHLHPKVQTRLADFFIAMSLQGKQCLIETHSEYLVNRLRYRIAAAEGDALVSTSKVYFVEKKGGQTSHREVVISKYGAISDWPEDFFDQSQEETDRILSAANRKHRAEREGLNARPGD